MAVLSLAAMAPGICSAADAQSLLRQADNQLRDAQRAMFSGKYDQSWESVIEAETLIEQARSQDPGNSKLASTERKLERLKKDMARRGHEDPRIAGQAAEPTPEPAQAEPAPPSADVSRLVREAQGAVRSGRRSFFSGKFDETAEQLDQARALLDQARAAAPGHPGLGAAERDVERLEKDLQRRVGPAPGTASAPRPSPATAQPPAQEGPAKLPYRARQALEQATRQMKRAEEALAEPLPERDDAARLLVRRAESALEQVDKELAKAVEEASGEGIGEDHPKFADIRERHAAAREQLKGRAAAFEQRQAADAEAMAEVEEDVQALGEAWEAFRAETDQLLNAGSEPPDLMKLDRLEPLLSSLETYEAETLPEMQAKLARFAEKYGDESLEIDARMRELGYSGQLHPGLTYRLAHEQIDRVRKIRPEMARRLLAQVERVVGGADRLHDFFFQEQIAAARAGGRMAERFHPEGEEVKKTLATLDERIEKAEKEWNARIDARSWPDHASDAPGDAGKLAKVGLAWFQDSEDWGRRAGNPRVKDKEPRVPLSVRVTGPWKVEKRDMLGRPVMYGLPILLAVELDREKKADLARVYELTLRTPESADPKKEPPFVAVTVGDSYYIRPAAVK